MQGQEAVSARSKANAVALAMEMHFIRGSVRSLDSMRGGLPYFVTVRIVCVDEILTREEISTITVFEHHISFFLSLLPPML